MPLTASAKIERFVLSSEDLPKDAKAPEPPAPPLPQRAPALMPADAVAARAAAAMAAAADDDEAAVAPAPVNDGCGPLLGPLRMSNTEPRLMKGEMLVTKSSCTETQT